MPIFNLKRFISSFKYAFRGLKYAFSEQTFKILLIASLLVIILMVILPVKSWQAVALILVITLILILELINTIFERLGDLLKPRIHHYIQVIKDIMAAVVLIASIGALIIGLIIFWPFFFS